MSVLSGIEAIRKKIEERPAAFDNVSDRELTRNIKSGQKRRIRFVQELDPEAKGYNEDYGLGIVVSEYQHPKLFWLLVEDTFDEEGECWAAEQGWASKLNLYVNVVDVDSGEVFYLARSVLGGLGKDIIESAAERNSVTDALWSIKKEGQGMNTKYTLTLVDITSDPVDVDTEKLIDFRKSVLNNIPSDEQAAFVRQVEQRVASKAADNGAPAGDAPAADDDDDDVW
jgi:hypothetical protein